VPIIGLGGVMSWREAAEFILAGASATGVGTALFVDPRAPAKVAAGLEKWVRRQGCVAIRELIGQVEL
jgi:dihydroorotate dehydrogenase (NAD+) catalytic subunit